MPTSPIGKQSFITLVQLLHVKEDNIWIAQLEKPSGSAAFMKPLVDLQLNSKANKDTNCNMDPLQIMGKSSFLLFKKQLNIKTNMFLPVEDHCISMHQWFQCVITFQLKLDFV